MYGASRASIPPKRWTSSVCSSTSVSITSSTVTMPRMRRWSSMTGTASRLYFEISRAASSRSVSAVTVSGARRLPTSRTFSSRGGEELAQRYDVHQRLRLRIDDVDRVHCFLPPADFADQAQRLIDRPVRWNADELGRHDSARGVRRILEELLERGAGRLAHRREQARPLFGRDFAEQVGLLVGRHRFDKRSDAARIDVLDDRAAVACELRLVEHLHRQLERKRRHHLRRRFRWQLAQRLGDVGRAQLPERFLKLLWVVVH